MKTMLKTKRWFTGFFGSRYLLLALPGTLSLQQKPGISTPFPFRAPLQDIFKSLPKADTSIVDNNSGSCNSYALNREAYLDSLAFTDPVPINKQAAAYIKTFLHREGADLFKIKLRCQPYFAIMDDILQKYELPVELKYLAIVESGLQPKAISNAGAAGLWQLMPVTARELGLKITSRYDERKHCYKSTTAAAKYLKALYAELGDWLLVLAAYNGGTAPIYHAIHKSGSRNFWRLQYYLPLETRLHVKRFIATHYYFEGRGSMATLTRAQAG